MFIVKDSCGSFLSNGYLDSSAECFGTVMEAHEAVERFLYDNDESEATVTIIDLEDLTAQTYVVRHSFQWEPVNE